MIMKKTFNRKTGQLIQTEQLEKSNTENFYKDIAEVQSAGFMEYWGREHENCTK